MPSGLSKSLFVRGTQCSKSLWLYCRRKELIPPTSPALQRLFDDGRDVGVLARSCYPGGTLVEGSPWDVQPLLHSTMGATQVGASCLYEAAFLHDDVLVRVDILTRNADGTWDLTEVKMSTKVKPEHVPEVALQRYVLEGAGLRIRRTMLMHVNPRYVRAGSLDVSSLFQVEDITRDTTAAMEQVRGGVGELRRVLALDQEPRIDVGPHCRDPHDCEFIRYCWRDLPEYSIHDLARLSKKKLDLLRDAGVIDVRDVPPSFPLSDLQRRQVDIALGGRPHVDTSSLSNHLRKLSPPLHFLDFETIAPAIPPYDGLHPYEKVPFQASLRLQSTPAAEPEHHEFLGDGLQDPRPALVEFLLANIHPRGSIVVYNATFEGDRLAELGRVLPDHASQLTEIKQRLWDLAAPFRDGSYVHPAFKGSWSIKVVLPALVAGMSYEGLTIKDGEQASASYATLMAGGVADAERLEIVRALREYCGLDTLAMVRLLEKLRQTTDPNALGL